MGEITRNIAGDRLKVQSLLPVGADPHSYSDGLKPHKMEDEVQSGQMAKLVDQIKASGAPALFLDEVEKPAHPPQIADGTGVKIIEDLHVEPLTNGAAARTYLDIMKYNVTRIVNALK